jgi:hypothetical protein
LQNEFNVRFGVVPLQETQIFWFASIKQEDAQSCTASSIQMEEYLWYVPNSVETEIYPPFLLIDRLLEIFKDWDPPILDMIKQTPPDDILKTAIYKLPFVPHWNLKRYYSIYLRLLAYLVVIIIIVAVVIIIVVAVVVASFCFVAFICFIYCIWNSFSSSDS